MQGLTLRMAAALTLAAGVSSSCRFHEGTAGEHFERTLAFEPGGVFRLENVNGTVTLETWDRRNLEIQAEKTAFSRRLLEEIRIEIEAAEDRVEVRTRMPRRPRLLFGGSGKVDYQIRLPAEARVEVETVNGKLQIDGVSGRVRASTVNGSVLVTGAAGELEASTVNGSIEASYRKVDREGRHRFSTTNGSVTLYLPEDTGGDFEARTVNGAISTDFPLEVSGKFGGRHLRGRLGEGRGSFDIRTVNGSVKIRKG